MKNNFRDFGKGILIGVLISIAVFAFSISVFPSFITLEPSCPEPSCPECPKPSCPEYKKPEVDLSCPEPKCPDKKCPQVGLVQKIAENNGEEHTYQLDDYDCTEFSRELARRFEDKGFDANTKKVIVDCSYFKFDTETCEEYNGHHMIVVLDDVYIEATTGHVIDPQNYDAYGLS